VKYPDRVKVIRRGPSTGNDDYNRPIPGPPVVVDQIDLWIQPLSLAEMASLRDAGLIVSSAKAYTTGIPDVRSGDRLAESDTGIEWTIDGQPVNQAGVDHHYLLMLSRVG